MVQLATTKFKTEGLSVTSTSAGASADVLYTVPKNYSSEIKFLHLSNGSNSNKKAYVQFYHDDDSTYYYIANGLAMSGHSVVDLTGQTFFHLHQNDKLVVYKESGMTLDVVVSIEEFYNPLRG
jgi:hypothetical protein